MARFGPKRLLASALLVGVLIGSTLAVGVGAVAAAAAHPGTAPPTTLPNATFVAAPPAGSAGPDDITLMPAGWGSGAPTLIWTAYQNHINPNGTPGTTGGATQSTIAGYSPTTGALVHAINVTGKVDGIAADPLITRLVATVNEDANSALYLVNPYTGLFAKFNYTPSPEVNGNGGTDSVAIWHGQIYLSHSNPNDTTQATQYRVTLDYANHTAFLTPLFYDDSLAVGALTGGSFNMALTDPDTNYVMPSAGESYGGQLATISQGDGKIIFASGTGPHKGLTVLNLTDNVSGNVPPADGLAVATSDHGTLYVVDAGTNQIIALTTDGWPQGTVFIGEPNDNGNPLVGTLDLATGVITPFGNHFVSPKGLLFVPDPPGSSGGHHGDGDGDGDDQGHDDGASQDRSTAHPDYASVELARGHAE